ncbi:putative gastrointestinal growth factor xP4 [Eleutherodactylus coqui]|uniref:putative gastrointestinal growth factor xP4 n=1 Tax=Eleutherodactylus coqui TaxID=57060 RepID=UPI0034622C7A
MPSATASKGEQCEVDPKLRRNCGYLGISKARCEKRGCCYNSTVFFTSWCFFSKSQEKAQCSVGLQTRQQCGFPGIPAKVCYSRGCCFDANAPRWERCFYPQIKDKSVFFEPDVKTEES